MNNDERTLSASAIKYLNNYLLNENLEEFGGEIFACGRYVYCNYCEENAENEICCAIAFINFLNEVSEKDE